MKLPWSCRKRVSDPFTRVEQRRVAFLTRLQVLQPSEDLANLCAAARQEQYISLPVCPSGTAAVPAGLHEQVPVWLSDHSWYEQEC